MAFENFPSTQGTPPTPPEPPKADWRFFLTIGLVIALLGTWGYIIWNKSNVQETIQQKDTQYAAVVTEKDTLKSLLDEATMRYDELKTSNAKKDSTITAKDRDITEKKARIQSLITKSNATKEELAEAKKLIAALNEDIESYKTEVERLKGENLQLTQEKAAVTQERDVAQKSLESANTTIKEKEDVIDVGSTLHAANFSIIGINEKGNGREKETSKAKKVDKLRIAFLLDENRIAPTGSKDLFISIYDPSGKVVAVESLGSGSFTTRDGENKTFTQRVQINYVQGQKQIVSFDWKQADKFVPGNYRIEVYHNGFKIGDGTAVFKKGGLFG